VGSITHGSMLPPDDPVPDGAPAMLLAPELWHDMCLGLGDGIDVVADDGRVVDVDLTDPFVDMVDLELALMMAALCDSPSPLVVRWSPPISEFAHRRIVAAYCLRDAVRPMHGRITVVLTDESALVAA
jgi:hypothetical protein